MGYEIKYCEKCGYESSHLSGSCEYCGHPFKSPASVPISLRGSLGWGVYIKCTSCGGRTRYTDVTRRPNKCSECGEDI